VLIVAWTVPVRSPALRNRIAQLHQLTAGSGGPAAQSSYLSRSSGRVGGAPPVNVYSSGSASTAAISSAWSAVSGTSVSRAVLIG
jgi:hypothetical protein